MWIHKMKFGVALRALLCAFLAQRSAALDAASFSAGYSALESSVDLMTPIFVEPFPLIGMTLEEMMVNANDNLVLNLADWPQYLTDNHGGTDHNTTALSILLEEYLIQEREASVVLPIDCDTLEPTMDSVSTGTGSDMFICADVLFPRPAELTSEAYSDGNLFESLRAPMDISVDSPQTINVGVRVITHFVDSSNTDILAFWPRVGGTFNATINLALGPVEFVAEVSGYMDGYWASESSTSCLLNPATCQLYLKYKDYGFPLPTKSLLLPDLYYYSRKLSYGFGGSFELVTDLGDFEVPENATFYIEEDNFYKSQILLNSTDLNIAEFLAFPTQDFLEMINEIDGALVRAQESAQMTQKMPYLENTFSQILATGSVLAPSMLDTFAMSMEFDNRDFKSLQVRGTFDPDANSSGVDLDIYTLKFLYLEGELLVNPDYPHLLESDQPDIKVCDLSGISEEFADAAAYAAGLAASITSSGCGVTVCAAAACLSDEDNHLFGCPCDIAVDADENGKVLITSIAWKDLLKTQPHDVQLMGLVTDPIDPNLLGFHGINVNEFVYPARVPRFKSLNQFQDALESALNVTTMNGTASVTYVPASNETEDGSYQVTLSFSVENEIEGEFDANFPVADLYNHTADKALTNMTALATTYFNVTSGVILAPSPEQNVVLLGGSCVGKSVRIPHECEIEEGFSFDLIYTRDGTVTTETIDIAASTEVVNMSSYLAQYFDHVAEVVPRGQDLLTFMFHPDITTVSTRILKECKDPDTNITTPDQWECPDKFIVTLYPNELGLIEENLIKRRYQMATGSVISYTEGNISGNATALTALNKVMDAEAEMEIDVGFTLEARTGFEDIVLPTTDWLGALVGIGDTNASGYLEDFFDATATLVGDIWANVTTKVPFESTGVFDMKVESYDPDFLNFVATSYPTYESGVDLPGIGDAKFLSTRDLADALVLAYGFLVGTGDEDEVDSCSGGMLGYNNTGEPLFQYSLPYVGIVLCKTLSYLKVFENLVVQIDNSFTALNAPTFNAFKVSLDAMLQDGFGGVHSARYVPTSSTNYSDLVLEITMTWDVERLYSFVADMETILYDGFDDDDNIVNFNKGILPRPSEGIFGLDATIGFVMSVGAEYDSVLDSVNLFLGENTTLKVTLEGGGGVSYYGTAGAFTISVDATYNVSGAQSEDDPLSIELAMPEGTNWYLDYDTNINGTFLNMSRFTRVREGFEESGDLESLVGEVTMSIDGAIGGQFNGRLPLIDADLDLYYMNHDIESFFLKDEANYDIELSWTASPVDDDIPTFIEILLAEPDTFVAGLDDVFKRAENAAFGKDGIVTGFPIPFIRNSLGNALGAGTSENIVRKMRDFVVPPLELKIRTYEGPAENVGELLAEIIGNSLEGANIKQTGEEVKFTCHAAVQNPDNLLYFLTAIDCYPEEFPFPTSVMWDVPIGQSVSIEIPLDFDMDAGSFPLEVEIGYKDTPPVLKIGWEFNLGFGFDQGTGFFLYSFPGDSAELLVEATFEMIGVDFRATLIFLEAEILDIDLILGIGAFIDVNKKRALGGNEPKTSKQRGRLSLMDLELLTKPAKLFDIGIVAGATVDISFMAFQVNLDFLGSVGQAIADWIPYMESGLSAFVIKRKSFTSSTAKKEEENESDAAERTGVRRRRSQRRLGDLVDAKGNRAHPLLRALGTHPDSEDFFKYQDHLRERGLNDKQTPTPDDILRGGYNFSKCPVKFKKNKTKCVRLNNVTLRADKILDLIRPVLTDYVNPEGTGMLDKIMDPVILFLDEPIPGISKIAGRDITTLNIAEYMIGPKSGAPTVEALIRLYKVMRALYEDFENQPGITLAEWCDPLDKFKCYGFLFDDFCPGGRRASALDETFGFKDRAGFGMSPLSQIEQERDLLSCTANFKPPTCYGQCNCEECPREKCKGRLLRCKNFKIPRGLSFPFMKNPFSVIGIIAGTDVQIVKFVPPKLIFSFTARIEITLWVPPTINVGIVFTFTVELELGFVLTTKGIQQAVEQRKPEKLLNSFALIDRYDGVDVPMLKVTAKVQAVASVSAAILKIEVGGGLKIVVTIDLYDGYWPESKGLVRPFELFANGPTPLDWFEFGIKIFVNVFLALKIGLFGGPIEITFFKLKIEVEILIFELKIDPNGVQPPGFMVGVQLSLNPGSEKVSIASGETLLECTTLAGTAGEEDIECVLVKDGPDIHTEFKKVGNIQAPAGAGDLVIRGLQSITDLTTYSINELTLDYRSAGVHVISNNLIFIQRSFILVGQFEMRFNEIAGDGLIQAPQPEQAFLVTEFHDGCQNSWLIEGHSNIYVFADLITEDCQITGLGGTATEGLLTIDFGFEERRSCADGNSVTYDIDGDNIIVEIMRADFSKPAVVTVASVYRYTEIRMSNCDDEVYIRRTHAIHGFIDVLSGGGDDYVEVGGQNGVDDIHKKVKVYGDSGNSDTLFVDDSGSVLAKSIEHTSQTMLGMLNGVPADGDIPAVESYELAYGRFEYIIVDYGQNSINMQIHATAPDSLTTMNFYKTILEAGGGNATDTNGTATNGTDTPAPVVHVCDGSFIDIININETIGDLDVFTGGGADKIYVWGLGDSSKTQLWGECGDDVLWVDGTADLGSPPPENLTSVNTMADSLLRWSGGPMDDVMNVLWSHVRDTVIEIFDDLEGINSVNVDCAFEPCTVYSRENFLVNVHEPNVPNTTMERITLVRESNDRWSDTASINSLVLRLNDGENVMYFDDTMAPMSVFGGPQVDEFYIGQMYNSTRDALAKIDDIDPCETMITTEGYVSNGNFHPVSIHAGGADDHFFVTRNRALLDLNGESGSDTIIMVASTHLAGERWSHPDYRIYTPKREDPDFVVNSYVDVDGGTHEDWLLVVGTEGDDSLVMSKGSVKGAGLNIGYKRVELLEISPEDDNDLITVQSTGADVYTKLLTSWGTDGVYVGPREIAPVVTNNLRGHRGIVSHMVHHADDPDYLNQDLTGIYIRGIDVNILESEGDHGAYVNVIETDAVHVMTQDGEGEFTFTVHPTKVDSVVTVNVVSQVDPYGNRYLQFNGATTPAIELYFTDTTPQDVTVTVNPAAAPLPTTEENVIIMMNVIYPETLDGSDLSETFITTEASLPPIHVKLISPQSDDDTDAIAVTIVEPTGKTSVLEGESTEYEVYLRPCTDPMKTSTLLTIEQTVDDDLTISPSTVTGADWGSDCKVTITVDAIADGLSEGTHFVALRHIVTSSGADVVLPDGSILYPENVLVEIFDSDLGGFIVEESVLHTSVSESVTMDDTYTIRLTKAPTGDVHVKFMPGNSSTDRYTWSQREVGYRDYDARFQVSVSPEEFTFDASNWEAGVEVTVTALADDGEEGRILYGYAPQESFLSFVQGSLYVSAVEEAIYPPPPDAFMLDHETDIDGFPIPAGYWLDTRYQGMQEDVQVDYFHAYNLDVRGTEISYGTFTNYTFTGFNMAADIAVYGMPLHDGINYYDFEVVQIFLGMGFDHLTCENTTEAMHFLDLGGGDDYARVKDIDGPYIVHGAYGSDTVELTSDEVKLDKINALFGFGGGESPYEYFESQVYGGPPSYRRRSLRGHDGDGGGGGELPGGSCRWVDPDPDVDRLIVRNTNDPGIDDVLNITRTIVEVESMDLNADRDVMPVDSFLIKIRGAERTSDGSNFPGYDQRNHLNSFYLNIYTPGEPNRRIRVWNPVTALELQSLIQRAFYGATVEEERCGSSGTSTCSHVVRVWSVGETFVIIFAGERLNKGITVTLETAGDGTYSLGDFAEEMFQNRTNDYLFRNTDIVYGHLEYLDIESMGDFDIVTNVRGTTAITTVNTQGGDDKFFVSSEANQAINNAGSVRFLHGWLDYLEKDLIINANEGRHRLMISDESSYISKGRDCAGPAKLYNDRLLDIHRLLGNIYFNAEDSMWSDGLNIWFGYNRDSIDVRSIPSNPDNAPLRTTTQVHMGDGDDYATVRLVDEENEGAVFVLNGQNHDDTLIGKWSTLPLIIFGDADNDHVEGGMNNDVLIGDFGRVAWRSSDNTGGADSVVEAFAGTGGYGDWTDGVRRNITDVYTVTPWHGDTDILIGHDGDDVLIGGTSNDLLFGGHHRDIMFGDAGKVVYHLATKEPKEAYTIACDWAYDDTMHGGSGYVDYLIGGGGADEIWSDGRYSEFRWESPAVNDPNEPDGMDMVFGDAGKIIWYEAPFMVQYATTTDAGCDKSNNASYPDASFEDNDLIYLGDDEDIAYGGDDHDTIYGEGGQDVILGDFGYYDAEVEILPFQNFATDIHNPEFAGNDTIYGGADDDFLMGQEHNDTIYGGPGRDDIYGGHHLRTGKDAHDLIYGNEGSDVVLGDNGEIVRHRLSVSFDPFCNNMLWLEYVEPFDEEIVHEIRRYDDIDYVEGDDVIYGDEGNDILHGQRGDDIIYGGPGEDELYGELGDDVLYGDEGNDILIGDVGYAIRRYTSSGEAIVQDTSTNTPSVFVWHKDIVLEEVLNITGVDLISRKLDADDVQAEDIVSADLLFVANAYKSDGTKYTRASSGGWTSKLMRAKMVLAYDDEIHGGDGDDILIGQRGDDRLFSGPDNNLVIGDAGWQKIAVNMDFPRISQIYRALADESGSEMIVNNGPDFGVTFTADFEIYPSHYQQLDALSSIIDHAVDMDDLYSESNLMKDKLEVGALSTSEGYCLQPMFRASPGFLYENQKMHGNDYIDLGDGENIAVGDDIRGMTGLDISDLSQFQSLRQSIDNLVKAAGVRLSTLEVDWEFFQVRDAPFQSFNISLANDEIETHIDGFSVASGDFMTLMGRTMMGGNLIERRFFFLRTPKLESVLSRLYDIQTSLYYFHFALYEIHTRLLNRMKETIGDQTDVQEPLHHLKIGNDFLNSRGNSDTVVGDSSLYYLTVDRPGQNGYTFKSFTRWQRRRLRRKLRRFTRSKDNALSSSISNYLRRTGAASGPFPYADLPWYLTAASDSFVLNDADCVAAGDYAFIGITMTTRRVPGEIEDIGRYTSTVRSLRSPPSVTLNPAGAVGYGLNFYNGRYSSGWASEVTPTFHGDEFRGNTPTSAVFGEFVTGVSYNTFSAGQGAFAVVEGEDAFSTSSSVADLASKFKGDYFDLPAGTQVDGQLGSDEVVSDEVSIDGDLFDEINSQVEVIFFNHDMFVQMKNDMWYERLLDQGILGMKTGYQCTDVIDSSYIPSYSEKDMAVEHRFSTSTETDTGVLGDSVTEDEDTAEGEGADEGGV